MIDWERNNLGMQVEFLHMNVTVDIGNLKVILSE